MPFLTVAALRDLADQRLYAPDSDSPSWLSGLGALGDNDPGVLALTGPSGISIERHEMSAQRAVPDAPALLLSALVDRIRGTERRIAIGLPPAARHLPLLLAASVVLATVVDRGGRPTSHGDDTVLIVSADLEVRSRYCDLRVGSEPLDSAFPGSRMRPDGTRVMLEHSRHRPAGPGVCFFLPGLTLPPTLTIRPTLILTDMRYGRWTRRAENLAHWMTEVRRHAGLVALYSISDTETATALAAEGFTNFPLDHEGIASCVEHVARRQPASVQPGVDWSLASAPSCLARKHDITFTAPDESVESALLSTHRLLRHFARMDSPELRRARWLLATLNQLPVPLVTYEYSARALGRSPLRHLIDGLDAGHRGDYGDASTGRLLKDAFDRLYRALWDSNPREAALRELIPSIVSQAGDGQILMLVRDRVTERAFQDWVSIEAFADAPWLGQLDIRACPTFFPVATRKYMHAIVNGAFPHRYEWIAGAALGAHVTFLAYPYEVDLIQRQLDVVYGEPERTARAQQRIRCVTELSSRTPAHGGSESRVPLLDLRLPARPAQPQPDAADNEGERVKSRPRVTLNSLDALGDAFQRLGQEDSADDESVNAPWLDDTEDEELPVEDVAAKDTRSPRAEQLRCLRVTIRSRALGNGIIWLAREHPVEVFRQSDADALTLITPEKLKRGDVLLLTYDAARTDLFDRIVQLAESQPELRYLSVRRKAWHEAVLRVAARYRIGDQTDYGAMLRSLQAAGTTIRSELAIRSWVNGHVIGPQDVNSIIAAGRLSGAAELVQHAREFDQAFRQIRGIHQSVGLRLSAAIRHAFHNEVEGADDRGAGNRLDQRLGIALDELLDSIDLAEVASIDHALYVVNSSRVGRFTLP